MPDSHKECYYEFCTHPEDCYYEFCEHGYGDVCLYGIEESED